MRNDTIAFFLISFCFLINVPTVAGADATYLIRGAGAASCGTWISERPLQSSPLRAMDESWVLGFLTGVNAMRLAVGNSQIGLTTDANGLLAWVDNYCRANPLKSISDTALALATELSATGK